MDAASKPAPYRTAAPRNHVPELPSEPEILRQVPDSPGDENAWRSRRSWYIGVPLLAAGGLILRQPLLFLAALLIGALLAVPEIWFRSSLRALYIARQPLSRRASFGETIEIVQVIENRKALPVPWLEIVDEYPEQLSVHGRHLKPSSRTDSGRLVSHLSLWAFQRVRRRFRVTCSSRGVYTFGPVELHATDPFGLLTREERFELPAVLLVHPLVVAVERFGLPASSPFGKIPAHVRLIDDPLRVTGIRSYRPGDEPRRIHWKATARTGKMQSKVYDSSARHTLVIFVEVRTFARSILGYDPDMVELAVTTAASAASWGIEHKYATGLYSNGSLSYPEIAQGSVEETALTYAPASGNQQTSPGHHIRVPPSPRAEQQVRILDALARLLPYYGLPMHELLANEAPRLPYGAAVVYIGAEAALDVPLILALRKLQRKGHSISILLIRQHVQDNATAVVSVHLAGLNVHYLGGRELWADLRAESASASGVAYGVTANEQTDPTVAADGTTRQGSGRSALRLD